MYMTISLINKLTLYFMMDYCQDIVYPGNKITVFAEFDFVVYIFD